MIIVLIALALVIVATGYLARYLNRRDRYTRKTYHTAWARTARPITDKEWRDMQARMDAALQRSMEQ